MTQTKLGNRHWAWGKKEDVKESDFSRYLENLSLNLSPCRRETLNIPPFRVGKGVRVLGFWWTFPHNVKSQVKEWRS
ncbi:hypothetical protein CDG76_07700 [Nostoc sp. 'Peltigera membranacea cyanobiont' 210A]|nr:hypothetical protein CDG76_07700 [Nostoc sp. 'Peltigera membranacea cyanobiont' 210A]